jgi:uncharacterized membrane protein
VYRVLGPTPLALRLPSVLGYLLMSVCLYRYAARWYPAPYAWLAMLFPLTTVAFWYASEGRPYSLVLGFSALALVCWQDAIDGVRRPLALTGLGLSLAAAVSTHYYAVLTVVPLAVGEAIRTWTRKRIDVAIWVVFVLGFLPLLAFGPLLVECRKYAANFWSKPSWGQTYGFYGFLLGMSMPVLIVLFFLDVVLDRVRWAATVPETSGEDTKGFPLHILAAAVVFAALPTVAVILAKVIKSGYTDRYALTTVIGVSLLVTEVSHRVFRGRTTPALFLVISLLVWCGSTHWDVINATLTQTPPSSASSRPDVMIFDRVVTDDWAVAVPHPRFYLESTQNLPIKLAARLVFLSKGEDTETRALRALSRLRPMKVVSYESFLAANKRFFVCTLPDPKRSDWAIARLIEEGAQVTVRAQCQNLTLYEVETHDP